jgi:hypothetical protein
MSAPDSARRSPEATPTTGAAVADTQPEPQGSRRDALSVGALLAVAPGVGFILSWAHEYAYTDQFGVPSNLIAPQLSDVLITVLLLVVVAFAVFSALELYLGVRSAGARRIGSIERGLAGMLVMALLVVAVEVQPVSLATRIFAPVAWVLFGLAIFVFTPIGRKGTYRERLDAGRLALGERDSLVDRIGIRAHWLFAASVAIIVLVTSLLSGGLEAAWQTNYLVTTSGPPELVVRIYGDTVILAEYDAATHQIPRRYHVQKLGNQPLDFEQRHLGHLSLAGS